MKLSKLLLACSLALLPATLVAHGPPRIETEEKIVIAAAPAEVWAKVKDFGGFAGWHPAVATSEATGNEPGATRVLTLEGGATLTEELMKLDDEGMTVMYKINEVSAVGTVDDHGTALDVPAVPVHNYKAWLSVKPTADGRSEVVWLGKYYRAYQGHSEPPPAELGDDAARNAITGIYQAGLAELKKQLER